MAGFNCVRYSTQPLPARPERSEAKSKDAKGCKLARRFDFAAEAATLSVSGKETSRIASK
jgi:hypothetical protein